MPSPDFEFPSHYDATAATDARTPDQSQKRVRAARRRPSELCSPNDYLNASFTFSPAPFRLPAALSFLPSASRSASPVASPIFSFAEPATSCALSFALSIAPIWAPLVGVTSRTSGEPRSIAPRGGFLFHASGCREHVIASGH